MSNLVAARYIGNHPVSFPSGRRFVDPRGATISSGTIYFGDEIMMPEVEILGQSFFREPSGDLIYLGPGKTVKSEHADFTLEQLINMGYLVLKFD